MAQLARDPSRPLGGFISVFSAIFALCSTSCASSSGTGAVGTPGDGGSAAQPGGTGGGSAQGGTAGRSETGSTAGNSGGSDIPAAAGASGACAKLGERCDGAGQMCASAETCCHCIRFPSAPSCGSLWNCAVPKKNTSDCPSTPPSGQTACSTARVNCEYCGANGPSFWQCVKTSDPSVPLMWLELAGLGCYE